MAMCCPSARSINTTLTHAPLTHYPLIMPHLLTRPLRYHSRRNSLIHTLAQLLPQWPVITFKRLSAENVVAMDVGGSSDPYCKFYTDPPVLLKKGKRAPHTSHIAKTLNPVYVSRTRVHTRTLASPFPPRRSPCPIRTAPPPPHHYHLSCPPPTHLCTHTHSLTHAVGRRSRSCGQWCTHRRLSRVAISCWRCLTTTWRTKMTYAVS